jgi:hypothetical protein
VPSAERSIRCALVNVSARLVLSTFVARGALHAKEIAFRVILARSSVAARHVKALIDLRACFLLAALVARGATARPRSSKIVALSTVTAGDGEMRQQKPATCF